MFADHFHTSRLILRPLVAGDASVIFETYAQDADVSRYLTWRPSTSVDETRRFVRMCLMAEDSRTYVIVLRATGAVLGGFDLRTPGRAKLDFGYVLARPFWGMGLMTEALCAVVDWALRQPGIWRIGGVADIDNIGSVRVMEKAGLHREGVLRRWHVHPNAGDAPRDCVSFSKTR